MKRYIFTGVVVLVLVSSVACTSGSTGSDPEAVMEAYEAAWNAKDLEAVLDMYAENGVETNNVGVFVGREEIESVLKYAMEKFSINCDEYSSNGTHVKYKCVNTFYNDGVKKGELYEAVVRDGMIYATIKQGDFTP
ncbi:MAG: hypothetical protein A2Z16_09865 [Chloroflexi bacterium RBG_16_54_18]|nr:MAG: hypothetical protein A2Z16_09865 [Chloroflexi bacterium RBG_16_54_18]